MSKSSYNAQFYEERSDSLKAANQIVPYILEITNIKRVVDIGCGNGAFLSTFNIRGVKDYLGIDGDWIDEKYLKIPSAHFLTVDFESHLELNQKYDLVLSLVVSEHISEEAADSFVKAITQLAPIILFSVVIQLQGGTHRVNEQWPKYWVNLFAKYEYLAIDCLRKRYWENKDVPYWYSQNMVLYVHKDTLRNNSTLSRLYEESNKEIFPLVLPINFIGKAKV